MAFHWDIAPVVLTAQPVAALLGTAVLRRSVLRLVSDLLAWTIMDTCPPFEREHGGRAYKWRSTFLEWCARLTEHLPVAETDAIILAPIREASSTEDSGQLLEPLMSSFIRHRFTQGRVPDASTIAVWGLLCEVLFAQRHSSGRRAADWLGRGYDECRSLTVFTYAGLCFFDHPWPALDAVRPVIETWVERFSASDPGYTSMVVFLSHAGRALLPDPALGWLQRVVVDHGPDPQFWRNHDNGARTAALLELMLDDGGTDLTRNASLVERTIAITDVLISVGVRQAARVQQRLAIGPDGN